MAHTTITKAKETVMHRLHQLLLSLVLVIASITSTSVWAHATLVNSTPASMAKLDHAPAEVVLKFSAALDTTFSAITVTDSNQKPVTDVKAYLDKADRTVLRLALPALSSGSYTVHWIAVADDGHRQKGEFSFTVK